MRLLLNLVRQEVTLCKWDLESDSAKSYALQTLKFVLLFRRYDPGIFFKAMWDSPNLKSLFSFSNIKPLLIAPIVFYSVYAAVNTLSDNLLAVLIAFQNGFFWQSILKAEQNKHETLPTPPELMLQTLGPLISRYERDDLESLRDGCMFFDLKNCFAFY